MYIDEAHKLLFIMPKKKHITVGSRVKAAIGQLQDLDSLPPPSSELDGPRPKKKRRSRAYLVGTVLSSKEDNMWRVYWDDLSATGDHPSNKLLLVSTLPENSTMNFRMVESSTKHIGGHREVLKFHGDADKPLRMSLNSNSEGEDVSIANDYTVVDLYSILTLFLNI